MGPPAEAESLLDRGINAYFSFGKQVLNGNKKVIACVRELPGERVLAETDAPFQYLKNEQYTSLSDIEKIISEIARLKSSI
jgi:TatD DNase family protein